MENFDLVVIGAGPGGYVAAIRAAQLGLKTAIIEKDPELGGTCLRIGCIPSKALLSSSDHFAFAKKDAAKHGVKFDNVSLDLGVMLARKDKVVKQLTGGVRGLMKLNKVTKFDGNVVVSSTEALSFSEVPKKMLVIGGGAIGLEMGSVWSRLGSEVTVVEFLPRIAVGFDLELANALQKVLTAQGMKFHLSTKVGEVKVENGRATATATKGDEQLTFDADKVLVSVGRRAFADGVGAEKVGVQLDERKRIKVDVHFRTNVEGIYAIGDVIAGPMLAHKAEEEGIACVEMIAGKAGHVNYDVIPGVIYTHPEAAGAGVTEDFAKENGMDVRVGKFPFVANGRALAADDASGFVKFVADAETDRIIGAHIMAHAASDLMAECVAVMEFGGSAEDLGRTVHAHPTHSEAVKEAALAVNKGA